MVKKPTSKHVYHGFETFMVEIVNWKHLNHESAKKNAVQKKQHVWGLNSLTFHVQKIILVKIIFSHSPKSSKGLPKYCMSVETFKILWVWHWSCTHFHAYFRRGQNVELGDITPLLIFQLTCCSLIKSLRLFWLNLLYSKNVSPKKEKGDYYDPGSLQMNWLWC